MPRPTLPRLTVAFAMILFGFAGAPAWAAEVIALTNAVVIDGTGDPARESATVIVRDGLIEAVGPTGTTPVPRGARVVNVRGQTVMPGLADMHVHLVGGWDGESVDMLGFERYMHAFLYAGVTTVLDTGNVQPYVIQLRSEVAAGRVLGPDIYCVGALVDGADPVWPPISYAVAGTAGIPRVVANLKRDRVDFIKGYAGLSNDQIRALVSHGAKANLRVIIDQWTLNGSIDVADTGVHAFAHLPSFRLTETGVAALRERNMRFITTLATMEAFSKRRLADLNFLRGPLIADTTPPAFLKLLSEHATRLVTPEEQLVIDRRLARMRVAMADAKLLHDGGILLVAGTDAPYPGAFQGESIHRELELLVEAGLTPAQAIAAATGNAAKFVGDDSWGTIAPGKRADLLVIAGRPDRNVSESRNVAMLMKRGRWIDRSRLKLPADDPGYLPVSPAGWAATPSSPAAPPAATPSSPSNVVPPAN